MGIGEEDEEGSSSALSLSNHTDTLGGSNKFGRRRCGGININMPLPNDEEKVDYNDNKDGMITGDVDSLLSADCRTTSQQAAKEGPAAAESRLVAADRRGGAPHHHHHHHPLNDNDFVTRKVDATKLKDVVSTNNLLGREDDARTEETQQGDDGGVPATTADVGEEESISSTSQPSCATSQSCEDHDDDDNGGEDHHSSEHQNDDAEEHTNNNLDKKNHHRHGEEEYQHRLDVAPTTFPQHLMDAIEQESQLDKPCILEWVEGGDAFLIRDKLAFERTVLPKYFSKNCKCKFISFVRKLYRQVSFFPSFYLSSH